MSAAAPNPAPSRAQQSGYAFLMAMFMVATLLLLVAMATPSVLTQGRREREQELIWRGNQYVRAIRLYYQKTGRYPQTQEDLIKPNAAGVHFLRKSYTDPENAADGSWRFIYVAPSGQLIGSVRYHTLQEMALAQGFGGTMPANFANPSGTAPAQAAASGPAGLGTIPQGTAAPAGTASGQQTAAQGSGGDQSSQQSGPGGQGTPPASQAGQVGTVSSGFEQPAVGNLEAVDGPVLGGNLIGIASKVKQPSLMVYQGGATYFQWEFIWNPVMNLVQPAGVTAAPAVPASGAAAPQNGTQNPTAPAPNPMGNPMGMPPLSSPAGP